MDNPMLQLDKDDYKAIGSLQEAVNGLHGVIGELKDAIRDIRADRRNDNQRYAEKAELKETQKEVRSIRNQVKYIGGISVGALWVLNFLQNGGLSSLS